MATIVGVVGLSLLAAFVYALGAALQQRAAAREGIRRKPLTLIGRLVRRRLWLGGWLINVSGFFVQAAALRVGNVAIVQPLLTTELLFAVPLSTMRAQRRAARRDVAGAIAICAGLATFLQVHGAAPLDQGRADRARLLTTLPFAAAFVLLLAATTIALHPRAGHVAASHPHVARPMAAAVLGTAAGICFAYTAAFIVLTTTNLLGPGVLATARDWPGYALAGSTATGIVIEQQAFATGTLPPALSTMTIANPVVSYVIGIVAFHISAPEAASAWAGLAGAAALIAIGVWLLATSPTARHHA